MFDRFGEFNSVEELNEAAKAQLEEGDIEAFRQLAAENGIDEEDAEDYLNAEVEELASPLMAAYGKLRLESEELRVSEIMEDWYQYVLQQCQESEKMARAVRKKGKSLKGCIAALLSWSFRHQQKVDSEILKKAGVTAARCTLGIPGIKTAKKLIMEYYLGK